MNLCCLQAEFCMSNIARKDALNAKWTTASSWFSTIRGTPREQALMLTARHLHEMVAIGILEPH